MLLTENKEKKYIKCIESIKNTSKRNKLKLISKLLFESFDSWIFCGFYFQDGDELLYQNIMQIKYLVVQLNWMEFVVLQFLKIKF